MMLSNYFPWTNCITVEGDRAWFVSARGNLLLEIDLQKEIISLCYEFTDTDDFEARQYHSCCIKYGDVILCAPFRNNYFWLYNLKTGLATKMNSGVTNNLFADNLICYGDRVFLIAQALGEILEIDVKSECICNKYLLADKNDEKIQDSVTVENKIYCICLSSAIRKIYQFDMDTKKIRKYDLSMIEDSVGTLCFDGECFWIGGCEKKLYIWNIETTELQILDLSPIVIGRYDYEGNKASIIDFDLKKYNDLIFFKIIATQKYIWCIPYKTDKILYIDKITKKIECLYIEGENETRYSLRMREISIKYIVEFVRANRYIGLYSVKQNRLIVIDAASLTFDIKQYQLDDKVCEVIGKKYFSQEDVFYEGRKKKDLRLFLLSLQKNLNESKGVQLETGKRINESIMRFVKE